MFSLSSREPRLLQNSADFLPSSSFHSVFALLSTEKSTRQWSLDVIGMLYSIFTCSNAKVAYSTSSGFNPIKEYIPYLSLLDVDSSPKTSHSTTSITLVLPNA